MKIISTVDDHMGLMFHQRRLSQDAMVRADMNEMHQTIYMNQYSYQLYQDLVKDIVVDENFLENHDGYCLVENVSVKNYIDKIDEVVLYYWNRNYPRDFYFDLDLSVFKIIETKEFDTKSHHITKVIYRKEK